MKLGAYLLGSMSLMIQQYADKYRTDDLSETLDELENDRGFPNIETYDFIVAGGGTAGCLIAGRLSEHFDVLLLENGGPPPPQTYNPYLAGEVSQHPAINYFFSSVPQTNFSLEDGGIVVNVPGKMLGGSGSHNGNVYNRGSPKDYDYFAEVTGDNSWKYENIIEHYQRLEKFIGQLVHEEGRSKYYGSQGLLTVDTDVPKILPVWFKAGKELGYKAGDPNGFQEESFTPIVKTIANGERVSTYTTFVEPYQRSRSRLHVLPYSLVDQVLINDDKIAYGVRYKRHGIPQIAYASKEVIVSAGTFSSPLLLMRSGIGPEQLLKEAKIPVKSALPGVGQNLKDHAAVVLNFRVNNTNPHVLPRVKEQSLESDIKKYQASKRTGPFTHTDVGPQALLVSSVAKKKGEHNYPDLQIVFRQNPVLDDEEEQTLSMQVVLNRLESVGEIGLNTTAFVEGERDDTKLALIDYRLLTTKNDNDALLDGIKLAFSIIENTTVFKNMEIEYNQETPEVCKGISLRSDEYWRCYIRQRAWSWLHVTGTCRMGKDSDPMAVVDSKLRVRGVKNLRVVDASVMPRPTNVNTNAPTMLLAEKTSQDIFALYSAPPVKGRLIDNLL